MAAGALANDVFLRFPGQWEDDVWQQATLGSELYYNVHRWYQPQTGRYTRADPLRPYDLGGNSYAYASANPIGSFDPLGLADCGKRPDLISCGDPGGSCCQARCIDDLRTAICFYEEYKTGITLTSSILGAGVGALGTGLLTRNPLAACVGGVVGGILGHSITYPFTPEDVFNKQQKDQFQRCIKGCRPDRNLCESPDNCYVEDLFALTVEEAKR
jgi:RHS repeat-associated protein